VSELTPDGRQGRPGPALKWVKSSLSFANSNCVEVASLPGGQVGVRDSKDPEGLALRFTPGEWQAFLGGVRNGEFDSFGMLCSLEAESFRALPSLASTKFSSGEGPSAVRGAFALVVSAARNAETGDSRPTPR